MSTIRFLARLPLKFLAIAPLATALALSSSLALAASEKSRQALADNPALEYAQDTILVKFKTSATPSQKQNARSSIQSETLHHYGIVNALEHLQLAPGQAVEKAVEHLQSLPFIEYAEPDYVLRRHTNDPLYTKLWGLNNTGQNINGTLGSFDADIDAEETWSITTGNPDLKIAVIDTGVDYTHEDLANNIWSNSLEIAGDGIDNDGNGYIDDIHGWDFYANDLDPMDEEGHGSHVAGTICAEGNNGVGVVGVVWQCNIMALRFLGPDGGYTSDAITALSYALDQNIKVSNNSWGGGGFSQSLHDAIQAAGNQNHLFMAAAGNGDAAGRGINNDLSPHYPSSYELDNIISVAATDNQDQIASFSNYGATSVDVGAPGVNIGSTAESAYYYYNGTSMATPYVTGVAALILSVHPEWTALQVRDRIYNTVRPIDALNGVTTTGGIINAYDALYETTVPPLAPQALSATVLSHSQIELNWLDNSDNEAGISLARSLDGILWTDIATVAQNVTTYTDSSLEAETLYYYQVKAYNSMGDSPASNTASVTTETAPSSEAFVANGEIPATGTLSGSYLNTQAADGLLQTITERKSGGRPSSRYSHLQHSWTFDIPPRNATFFLNAWSNLSSDGDEFRFSYSVNGSSYTEMLSVTGGDASNWYSYSLPAGISGTVTIQVSDSDHTPGNVDLDKLSIEHMYILTEMVAGNPPNAPSNLSGSALVAGQVSLSWNDNASDEYGFEVERSTDNGAQWTKLSSLASDSQTYTDNTVASASDYLYRIRAYNGAGSSDYSNEYSVTSLVATSLDLTASGFKTKGVQYVDLSWSNQSLAVDVYRDDQAIIENISGGQYSDGPLGKGGAAYRYHICETGGTACSKDVLVTF